MRKTYRITLPEELMARVQDVPAERGVTRDDIIEALLLSGLHGLHVRKRRIKKPNPILKFAKEEHG